MRRTGGGLRVLTLSCVYPNPRDPGLGLFVRSRVRHLSGLASVKVVAPVPQIDYAKSGGSRWGRREIPAREWDGDIEVLRPGWLYPPGGLSLNALLLFLRLAPLVAGLRKRFDFQVIDAHFAFPDGVAACLLAGVTRVPFTVTLRGNETMHAQYALRRRLIRWSLRKASRVITLSERLREFAVSLGADPGKVMTIPNGVDPATFHPRDRALSRAKYDLSPEMKVVLSAGSLIERKGHHRVLRATAGAMRAGADLMLMIAGGAGREGQYAKEIEREIADLGIQKCIRLLGEVAPEQMAELMSAADVLCLASTREGWPNVVHEAMACGTPVVATDAGAVAEMIPSRKYGIVVPVDDASALENALREALATEWDRTAISAWAHARTWEQVAREVFAELQSVVNNS